MTTETGALRKSGICLAVAATNTAVCISVLAGWQRGGWLSERLLWVAIGAVLVVSALVLPAPCKAAPVAVLCFDGVLWAGRLGARPIC